MSINRIQFQHGLSLPEFLKRYGTETQCEAALEEARWPEGFVCPSCSGKTRSVFKVGSHNLYQCKACRHQTSLTAGTLFQKTKLPLTTWFLAIYLVSQAKTGLSALALKRHLGVSYPTAWLMHHKLMAAMAEREDRYLLDGSIQVDDAYLGGERTGGKAGRGSENKVPFIAAVSLGDDGHPRYVKLSPVAGFTLNAVAAWAQDHLTPTCYVYSDGLACFSGVMTAGCHHHVIVNAGRKPAELPQFRWVNTLLGNLKTSLGGCYHAFKFAKYASRYLSAFAYRFNRRYRLDTLPNRLLIAAASAGPYTAKQLRLAEVSF
ncbi:MAG: IS1595 family transposase [Methyloglobulus sp.]|nr:IS1595 family transposase [Methyloglobulus sp.]